MQCNVINLFYSYVAALEKFKEQANRYPSLTSFDIVENYCKNSTGCVEIFKLLEGEKQMSPKVITFVLFFKLKYFQMSCILATI